MFKFGNGVSQDHKEPVKWFRLAAETGHSGASNSLAMMYEQGLGVAQNDKTAMKWWKLSAEQSYAFPIQSGNIIPPKSGRPAGLGRGGEVVSASSGAGE